MTLSMTLRFVMVTSVYLKAKALALYAAQHAQARSAKYKCHVLVEVG